MSPRKPVTRANKRPTCTCGKPVKIIDLYCRISEDYDGDGGMRSVDDQETDGRLCIEELGNCCIRIGKVWKDPDLSAWKKGVVRPDFNLMMARLGAREADGIWVYDLSRFTRKPIEGERLIEMADQGFIVISMDSTYDLSTADGKMQFRDHMTRAAHESDKISQRSTRGKRLKAAKGKSNASYAGFARHGNGGTEEQVEKEQKVIAEVARRILAREPIGSCAEYMNKQGFRTRDGLLWDANCLKRTLTAPSLAGLVEYKEKIVPDKRLPGKHALTEQVWLDLAELFGSRRRGRPAGTYLLSGLVRCGKCGAFLYGTPAKRLAPYKDGAERRIYLCRKIQRQGPVAVGCAGVSIDWRFLDDAVEAAVIEKLGNEEYADRLTGRAAEGQEQRSELLVRITGRKKLAKDKALKAGLGEIDEDEYEAWLVGHRRLMEKLNAELEALDVPEAPSTAAGEVRDRWDLGTEEERRAFVVEAFPRLTVTPAARGRWTDPADRMDWDGLSLPVTP
jgi:site-specific DNA recombinase